MKELLEKLRSKILPAAHPNDPALVYYGEVAELLTEAYQLGKKDVAPKIAEDLDDILDGEFRMAISHMMLGCEDNMSLDEFNKMMTICVNITKKYI